MHQGQSRILLFSPQRMQRLFGVPGPGWIWLLPVYRRFEHLDLGLNLGVGTGHVFLRGARYGGCGIPLWHAQWLGTLRKHVCAELVYGLSEGRLTLIYLRELRAESGQLALHGCSVLLPRACALFQLLDLGVYSLHILLCIRHSW